MKFTFARANAAKLMRLPLYAMASGLARIFPRDRRLWVFGRKTGVGEGPLRLLRTAEQYCPGIRLVWLAQDRRQYDEARSQGLEVYPVDSWQGRWLTLRAGVGVMTHGFGDLFRPFVPGMQVVQLWHGAPLKRIHLDAPNVHGAGKGWAARISAAVMRAVFARSARLIDMIPSPSLMVSERFRTAWGFRDMRRIRLTGDPRCDVLLDGEHEARKAEARALLCRVWGITELPRRLVLFAPTWRDGEADPTLPQADALRRMEAVLAWHDAWLVVRSHPWGMPQEEDGVAEHTRLRFLDTLMLHDINRAMNAFDVLMTDYSAIAMDYCLLRRPIVFFAPDLESYQASRGLYEDYAAFTGGEWFADWSSVAGKLDTVLGDSRIYADTAEQTAGQLLSRYQHYVDAGSSLRVLDEIAKAACLPAPRTNGDPIKVLHVSGSLGGVETYLRLLAEHNDPQILSISFVLAESGELATCAQGRHMPVHFVPMRREVAPTQDLRGIRALRRIVRTHRPDVVHLHSSKAGLLGRLACLGLGCRVVYTPHAYYYLGKQGFGRQMFLFAERLLDRIAGSHTLGTSPSEARRAVDDVGCSPGRVEQILNTVDAQRLATRRAEAAERRKVLLVARISEQKNIPMYLEVVRHLRHSSSAQCYLIGVGHYADDRQRLADMMEVAGLGESDLTIVEWLPRAQLTELMARAAVVVLTSVYESFGYVLAEANCLGIPVVGTDVDGIRDVVEHERSGFLVPPGDAAAMASCIESLLDCPDLWQAMSTYAKDAGARRFDIRHAMPLFEAFYARVARGN